MAEIRRVMPVLTVDDLTAARALYVDVLGLDEVMNHGWIALSLTPLASGSSAS